MLWNVFGRRVNHCKILMHDFKHCSMRQILKVYLNRNELLYRHSDYKFAASTTQESSITIRLRASIRSTTNRTFIKFAQPWLIDPVRLFLKIKRLLQIMHQNMEKGRQYKAPSVAQKDFHTYYGSQDKWSTNWLSYLYIHNGSNKIDPLAIYNFDHYRLCW